MNATSTATRRLVTSAAVSMALLLSSSARADETAIPRIGALLSIGNYSPLLTDGLRDGLRELGYEERKNILGF